MLELCNVYKRFSGIPVVQDVSFTARAGEVTGYLGPNGSGKSTLVNCICGTLVNETGTVRFNGETVDRLLTHELQ